MKKYVGGVDKIEEAKKEVEEMSKVLVVKKGEVAVASKETEELLVVIAKEKSIADEQEKTVSAEAEKIGKEEAETKIIASQAQNDLDKAIPALNAAADALSALNKNHINETKSFVKPPPAVEMVMAAVLILRKAPSTDWAEAKKHLSDMNFLQQLVEYDKVLFFCALSLSISFTQPRTNRQTHTHVHAQMCTYTHTHTHIHTYRYAHTHTHTHTHTSFSLLIFALFPSRAFLALSLSRACERALLFSLSLLAFAQALSHE